MAMQLRRILIIVLLLLPCNVHAGWFGWFFGGQPKTAAVVIPPGTQAVPAMDVYGLSAAAATLIFMMRRRK
jgi:hypothetical protein